MEGTRALLANLVQTKSIERVLAPIANQVSQLIILNESYEHGDTEVFPEDLVGKAQEVQHSADELAAAALRYAHHSQDEELKSQMPGACELLTVAGSNFLTASQRVDAENFSHGARRHLIRSAKDVLEGTLKVLLVSDDADVRKTVLSAKCLLDRLRAITGVTTLQELVPAFKSFTEALMLLTNLVNRRQGDLIRQQQKERLIVTCTTLRKSVPMLSTAMQTNVKFPDNQQAQSSKEFAVGQVIECVHDIIDALENKTNMLTDEEYEEHEQTGSFVGTVDKLVNMLSAERRLNVVSPESEFDVAVETAVRLSMSVAHLSCERHRSLIIRNCQQILQQKTTVYDTCRNVYDNPELSELRCDYDELCDDLVQEFEDLERHVASAVLQLTVEAFKETTEPLERLVKAALKPLLEDSPIEKRRCEHLMEPYIEAFHAHTDKMCQVARFVAASSSQAKNARQLRTCLAQLERLDPELLPAVLKCRQDVGNPGALQHLRMLKSEWTSCVELLVSTIDDATNPNNFVEVADLELRADASQCKRSLQMDASEVAEAVKPVIGGSHRFAHVVGLLVDSSSDAVYRNSIMVYLNQFNKVIPAIKSAGNRLVNDPSKVSLHESLHKRCDLLLRCVDKVRQALIGTNQPDLLSDLRCNVRSQAVVKSLYFGGDNDTDDQDGMRGQSPQQMSLSSSQELSESSPEKSHVNAKSDTTEKESQEKQAKAIKQYVSDLTSNRLKEAVKSLVSTAVAGQQKQVDQLCSDFVVQSNHVIELANSIASCNKTHEETLRQYASDVTNLTPQLLDKAHRVVAMDTYQIEPLHQTADLWASKVTCLEEIIDNIARQWMEVSEKVMDAGKMGNVKLLRAQLFHLDEHRRNIHTLMKTAFDCIDGLRDVVAMEKGYLLKDTLNDLDNQCAMFSTLADLSLHSDSACDHMQLHQAGREWAAKVYCLLATVDLLSMGVISQVRGGATIAVGSTSDIGSVQTQIRNFTAENIRWRALVESLQLANSEDKHEDLRTLVDELDLLTSEMNECLKLMMTVGGAPTKSLEKLYSPHKLTVLQWQWALKVQELSQLVDLMTMDLNTMLSILDPDENAVSSGDPVDKFDLTFSSTKVKIVQVLQDCKEPAVAAKMRGCLNELDLVTQRLINARHQTSGQGHDHEVWLRRQWCCHALVITQLLKQISTPATEPHITEIFVKLRGASSSMLLSSSTVSPILQSPNSATGDAGVVSGGQPNHGIIGKTARVDTNLHSTPVSVFRKGPIAVHTQPEPPTSKSGYKPRQREHASNKTSMLEKFEKAAWEEKNDAIIRVAKEMTRQLSDMTEFTRKESKECNIKSKEELISTAKLIAKNGEELVKFATNLADFCVDKRLAKDLLFYAEHVPSVATQLNILANVKAATPDDTTTEKMLIRNAENLMDAITKMLRAAEATSMKGYNTPPPESADGKEAVILATQWRRKLDLHRELESTFADTDDLGLRKVNRESAGPVLDGLIKMPR